MNGSEEGEREEGVDMVGKEGEVRRGEGEGGVGESWEEGRLGERR